MTDENIEAWCQAHEMFPQRLPTPLPRLSTNVKMAFNTMIDTTWLQVVHCPITSTTVREPLPTDWVPDHEDSIWGCVQADIDTFGGSHFCTWLQASDPQRKLAFVHWKTTARGAAELVTVGTHQAVRRQGLMWRALDATVGELSTRGVTRINVWLGPTEPDRACWEEFERRHHQITFRRGGSGLPIFSPSS